MPRDARPTVSAVIITRNRKEALSRVLDRLLEQPVGEILVVDNGSSDGTAEHVRGYGDPVRLLEPGENLGLGGRNLAAGEAAGELLLMLDDDCFPLPGSVEALAEAFGANPSLGVAGGFVRDVDSDGNVIRQTELGTFDWWLRAGRKGERRAEGWPAFSFPEGACMIRRQAYLEAGGFFAPYFLASSEVDLGARLQANGWEVRYFPQAAFDHMKAELRAPVLGGEPLLPGPQPPLVHLAPLPDERRRPPHGRLPRVRPRRVDVPPRDPRLGAGGARRVAAA